MLQGFQHSSWQYKTSLRTLFYIYSSNKSFSWVFFHPFELQFPKFDSQEIHLYISLYSTPDCITLLGLQPALKTPKSEKRKETKPNQEDPVDTIHAEGNHLHLHQKTSELGYLHLIILIKNKREFHVRNVMINCNCQKLICLKEL